MFLVPVCCALMSHMSNALCAVLWCVTQVTERGSVTPSEMAAWEAKMSEMERTLKDEKIRRQR